MNSIKFTDLKSATQAADPNITSFYNVWKH